MEKLQRECLAMQKTSLFLLTVNDCLPC